MFSTWWSLTTDGIRLGFEAQEVIALRMMKIVAGGPAAHKEAARMTAEKLTAAAEAMTTFAMGGSGRKVIRRYRTHVRANARRLSKSPR
jgi:hypothetical protein